MILLYIENKKLLTKIINYIENAGISYTTDLNVEFEYLIIAETSNKVLNFINNDLYKNKKIIFITYLEEEKIIINSKKNKLNNEKLFNLLNKCYKVIVSLPSIKNILKKIINTDIVVIEKELPIINISKSNNDIYNKYKISKRKKKITIIDLNYNNIKIIYELSLKYKKFNIVYVGFKPDYLIKENDLNLLYNMPKNVSFVKYYDFNVISDICKVSHLIINFEELNLDIKYLYMILLFKKQLLMKENILYSDYLINSKNSYLFKDNKDLLIRLGKIIDGRVSNLTDNGYLLVKDSTFNEIVKKYSFYIR